MTEFYSYFFVYGDEQVSVPCRELNPSEGRLGYLDIMNVGRRVVRRSDNQMVRRDRWKLMSIVGS